MIRRPVACLLVLIAVGLLAGCSKGTTSIVLAPRPEVGASDIGAQAPVLLTVSDDRPASEGNVTDTLPSVSEALQAQVSTALKAKGFRPVTTFESPTRRLDVHLTTLAYDTQSKTLSSTVTVRMALSVSATAGGRTYRHDYSSMSEETVAFGASETTRERAVNSAMQALLTKLFADDDLFRSLAGSQ